MISDLGSMNGTRVNGWRLTGSGAAAARWRDRLRQLHLHRRRPVGL